MNRLTRSLAGVALIAGSIASAATLSTPIGAAEGTPTFGYALKYSSDVGCDLVKIDLGSGEITDLSEPTGFDACASDLALDADGTPWGIDERYDGDDDTVVTLIEYSPTSGAAVDSIEVDFGPYESGLETGGIAIIGETTYIQAVSDDCDEGGSVCLFEVDLSTGSATQIGTSGRPETQMDGLANCGDLVTAMRGDGGFVFATVSSTTGAVTPVSPMPSEFWGFDCAGSSAYAIVNLNSIGEVGLDEVSASAVILNLTLSPFNPTTGELTGTPITLAGGMNYHALALPQQVVDTTTTTAPSTTTTSTSTTIPPRNLANTVQPRFAG